jgi:putative membrane protein
MVKKLFTQLDRDKIKLTVAQVEKNTRGEIVPVVVATSAFYGWVHWLCGAIGLSLATLFLVFWNVRDAWPFEWFEIFLIQFLASLMGVGLSALPFVKRALIPRSFKDAAVHEAALASFITHGVHQTKEHTGILIFISLFEQQVEILGDKGIHEAISTKDFWQSQTKEIVRGIHAGQASDGLINAINSMGKILAQHFPSTGDNPNELPDDIRG